MVTINLTYKENGVQVPPVVDDFDEFMNSLFTFRAKSSSARLKGSPTVLADDGDEVGLIKDENGNTDLPYTGATVPNNTKKLPIFKKQFGYYSEPERSLDFVFMENQEDVRYNTIEDLTSFPRTYYNVFYQPDFHIYEAYANTNFLDYWGEKNERNSENTPMEETIMRFATGNTEAELSAQLNKNSVNSCIRVIEEIEGDDEFCKITIYVNGNLIGDAITWKKEECCLGFGTDTNCEMHGFIEMGRLLGLLSPTEIEELNSRLNSQYNINDAVVLPYSTDLDFTIVGDIVTLGYNFISPTDSEEDESKRKIEWSLGLASNGIQGMEQIPEIENMLTFNKSTLTPGKFVTGDKIRANIYVEDVNGFGCLLPGVILKDI